MVNINTRLSIITLVLGSVFCFFGSVSYSSGYEIEEEVEPESETELWKDGFVSAMISQGDQTNQTLKELITVFELIVEKYGSDTESLEDGLEEVAQTNKAIADELERRIELSRIGYNLKNSFDKLME